MFHLFRSHVARPVFVIGSYRSATSVLTWSLGQHNNLFPLEETHFLYKLGVDLEYLYQIGSAQGDHSFIGLAGLTPREFRTHLGQAGHMLIMNARDRIRQRSRDASLRDPRQTNQNIKLGRGRFESKRRWVDGTPENSHFVLPLLRMFPEAKFIHILRNPRSVATSLMHFSTMGASDYQERDAYETWTRLVRDAALSEQAFGPKCVMRLWHDDLVADPESALRQCMAFIGEPYRGNCLLPLRQKLNSSTYDDPGDCSIEHNLTSPEPWVRAAFELYARLRDGKDVIEGGPCAARRTLHRQLKDYSESLAPATNERLSMENQRLRQELDQLQNEVLATKSRLKRIEQPMTLVDWGPHSVTSTMPFNEQPCGNSALWMVTNHAPTDTVAFLGGVPLVTTTHPDGRLVTALVPAELTAQPGELELHLQSSQFGERTASVKLRIKAH